MPDSEDPACKVVSSATRDLRQLRFASSSSLKTLHHDAPLCDTQHQHPYNHNGKAPYSRCLSATLTFALACLSISALMAHIHRSRSSYHISFSPKPPLISPCLSFTSTISSPFSLALTRRYPKSITHSRPSSKDEQERRLLRQSRRLPSFLLHHTPWVRPVFAPVRRLCSEAHAKCAIFQTVRVLQAVLVHARFGDKGGFVA